MLDIVRPCNGHVYRLLGHHWSVVARGFGLPHERVDIIVVKIDKLKLLGLLEVEKYMFQDILVETVTDTTQGAAHTAGVLGEHRQS